MEIKKLSKKFDKVLFENLNLKLEDGKIYLLKGISGCGKTTLLNIIANLDSDYDGECLYDGKDLKEFDKNEKRNYRKKVGYINQQSLLIGDMTVYDNLCFISDDKEYIEELAQKFGVLELLNKMPSQMSGGERQRISIIRALLKRPDILIADEPTASLDNKNSKMIAEAFEIIKSTGVITVVSTHENIFDNIADVTVNMYTDGTHCITDNDNSGDGGKKEKIESKKGRKNAKYCLMQLKKSKNLVMVLMLILIQAVLLGAVGMLMNFRREFVSSISEDYRSYILQVENYQYEELIDKCGSDKIEKLDFYRYEEEYFNVYSLLPEEDSSFAIEGALECGTFPQNENEVLVDALYAGGDADSDDYSSEIGKTIMINGKEYKISGVIIGRESKQDKVSYSEAYGMIAAYNNTDYTPAVFAMESVVKPIGEKVENSSFNIKFKDFYKYSELLDSIADVRKESQNYFSTASRGRISNGLYQIELINTIVIIVIIAISVIMIIFVQNQINMAMFYRRTEFGYLQLFGVEASRIKLLVFMENMIKALLSIMVADTVYLLAMGIVKANTGMNLICSGWIIAALGIGVLFYYTVSSFLPVRRILKEDIVKLIR